MPWINDFLVYFFNEQDGVFFKGGEKVKNILVYKNEVVKLLNEKKEYIKIFKYFDYNNIKNFLDKVEDIEKNKNDVDIDVGDIYCISEILNINIKESIDFIKENKLFNIYKNIDNSIAIENLNNLLYSFKKEGKDSKEVLNMIKDEKDIARLFNDYKRFGDIMYLLDSDYDFEFIKNNMLNLLYIYDEYFGSLRYLLREVLSCVEFKKEKYNYDKSVKILISEWNRLKINNILYEYVDFGDKYYYYVNCRLILEITDIFKRIIRVFIGKDSIINGEISYKIPEGLIDDIMINNVKIKSLKNLPLKVRYLKIFNNNELKSLEGEGGECCAEVEELICKNNGNLETLRGCPKKVKKFKCIYNFELKDLTGLPNDENTEIVITENEYLNKDNIENYIKENNIKSRVYVFDKKDIYVEGS